MSSFRYATDRDSWDRQIGESGEQHDWFLHWRNEGHRRSYSRVAEVFEVSAAVVTRAARRNKWTERLAEYQAENSRQLAARFAEVVETGLVPFAQAFALLSAHAVTADLSKIPADRALAAATAALRVIKEPGVADLIKISAAAAGSREVDALGLVLDRLAVEFPDAHDAVLDALGAATDPDQEPDDTSGGSEGDPPPGPGS